MEVQHKINEHAGFFFVAFENREVAKISYKIKDPGTLIILHTEVNKEMQGKQLGRQLVDAVVNYARKLNMKIIPACTYAHAVFLKNEGKYADIWKRQ